MFTSIILALFFVPPEERVLRPAAAGPRGRREMRQNARLWSLGALRWLTGLDVVLPAKLLGATATFGLLLRLAWEAERRRLDLAGTACTQSWPVASKARYLGVALQSTTSSRSSIGFKRHGELGFKDSRLASWV